MVNFDKIRESLNKIGYEMELIYNSNGVTMEVNHNGSVVVRKSAKTAEGALAQVINHLVVNQQQNIQIPRDKLSIL